jgi:uncharacterized protein DUF4421
MNRKALLLTALLLYCFSANAQLYNKPDHDTTYYRSFKGSIIARIYLARRYNVLKLEPPGNLSLPTMNYHANNPLSLGVGLTYRSFSASFSKGLDFLKSDAIKGRTHSTDIQLHIYKRKWVVDAIGEFYKGYYLNPFGLASPDGKSYYIRPDMGVQIVGASVYRVLNDQRFSYGAGLSQNAWQQKSAGSFLIGGEAFYTSINADSALAPHSVDSVYNSENIRKVHVFEIGPGIGYAYTLVIQKHYFLLGSFNANINFRFTREIGDGISKDKFGFSPNFILRLGTGYTTSKWSLGFVWVATSINTEGKASSYEYTMATGSYRLVYAMRIALNHKMKTIIGNDPY